ncbi:MAG: MFS transporter [Propionibacteriaceae bacterium]
MPVPSGEIVAGDSPETSADGRRRRIPLAVLGLGTVSLLTDISSESVAAVLPLYITAILGMGPLAYGFIDGIHQGISALVRIFGGWWADTTRRPKWVAFAGYAASAASRFGLLGFGGFWGVTSMVGVDRLGKGLRTGPRDSLIAVSSDPADLGRNFGVHRAMDTTGALIGPLLALVVLALFPIGLSGYHAVFVLSAAFAVIGLAVLALMVPDLRQIRRPGASRTDEVDVAPAHPARPRLADMAQPQLRRLVLAAGLLGLVTIGDGFIYLALADQGALATHYFPLLFVGTNAAYLALAIPFGRLADRIGRARVFLGGHLLLLVVYVLTAARFSGTAWIVLVLLLLGAFYASTDGVLAALASRMVPEESRASGISAAQTVVALSRFGASVGFGILWQLGSRSLALWVVALALAVAIPVVTWLLLRPGARDAGNAAASGVTS